MKKTTKELLFLCFPLTKRLENASKVFFFVGKKKIVLGVFFVFFVFFELRQFSCKQRCRRCGMQKLFEIRKKNCYFEKTFVVDQNKKNCCLKKPLLSIKKFVV
jgi:hypothetical protein